MYRKLAASILVGNITQLYREAPNITNKLIGGNQSPLVNYHTFHIFCSFFDAIKMRRGVTKYEPQSDALLRLYV